MRKLIAASILPVALFATSCRTNQVMWGACEPGSDPWGTDGTYVLGCKGGEWIPVMTVGEFVAIKQGKKVTIAPLPTKPTPTTVTPTTVKPTTTTTPATTSTVAPATTSTTAPATTTTTVPVVAPVINDADRPAGPDAGGQIVGILGTGFTGTTSVTFGGVAATFTVTDDGRIDATTPAHAGGVVDIVVTNPAGSATHSGDYEFMVQPQVDSISPASGPAAGGTTVTITGSGLQNADVNFGTAAAVVVSSSPTSMTVTAPAGTVGSVNVRATTWGGLSDATLADEFTYL